MGDEETGASGRVVGERQPFKPYFQEWGDGRM